MYIETSPNKVGKYHLIEWLKQWARAQCYGLLFDYFLKALFTCFVTLDN